jgi:hypothetical protein
MARLHQLHAEMREPAEILFARGFDPAIQGGHLHRSELDRNSPERPVLYTQAQRTVAYSFVKPSLLHCSEPTPLWTKNSPSGSYFCLMSARRA